MIREEVPRVAGMVLFCNEKKADYVKECGRGIWDAGCPANHGGEMGT